MKFNDEKFFTKPNQNPLFSRNKFLTYLKNSFDFVMIEFNFTYRKRAIISRGLYVFHLIFTAVYIVEWLVLQTIHVLNKKILPF